jgi:hypothetical protein
MKKIDSGSNLLKRIHNNEPFWVVLPPHVLQRLTIKNILGRGQRLCFEQEAVCFS